METAEKSSAIFLLQFSVFLILSSFSLSLFSQPGEDSLTDSVSLDQCLAWAMQHSPVVKQLELDERISQQDIRIAYSDWLPQITSSADYQYYLKQPVIFLPNFSDPLGPKTEISTGVKNNSTVAFAASQILFNPDVYLAARTSGYYRQQSKQNTRDALISMVADISKAYYGVIGASQQVSIIREDIQRINKSLRDAYAKYETGVSDDIDYKRATISLNNAKTQLITAGENMEASLLNLKKLIEYPEDKPLTLKSDFSSMEKEIRIDKKPELDYSNRIEYQLLKTNIELQKSMVDYYRLNFLPTLSGFATYNIAYHNDNFTGLYSRSFPNSLVGLTLDFPIFQGTKRIANLKKANLTYDRMTLDTLNLRNQMSVEFSRAMASYKSYLTAYLATIKNEELASEVYNTVKSQYDQGIKSFLEVIVSETDLRTAQINHINTLVLLLSAKVDLERSMGKISVNY